MTSRKPCRGRARSRADWKKSHIGIPIREPWSSRSGIPTDITSASAHSLRRDPLPPCRKQASNEMALPHPQARQHHDRKEDEPGRCCVVRQDVKRAVDIAGDRNGADDVNPADDHALGGISHDEYSLLWPALLRRSI